MDWEFWRLHLTLLWRQSTIAVSTEDVLQYTFTVGFGRRVGKGENLGGNDWSTFQVDVARFIGSLRGATIYSETEGGGVYDGVREDCANVVFGIDCEPVTLDTVVLPYLRGGFGELARRYRQDSIALTIGKTEFIGS